jgi:uncharacterized protein
MWQRLASLVLKYRLPLLFFIGVSTFVMLYFAIKVQLTYEFTKAIPTDNPKYIDYIEFKKKFGDDGNVLVIAFTKENFFEKNFIENFIDFNNELKKVEHVNEALSVTTSLNLLKNDTTEKLYSSLLFQKNRYTQLEIDSLKNIFLSLQFYKGLLYNSETNSYLIALRINKEILNSAARIAVVEKIQNLTTKFAETNKLEIHLSGLPLIRTIIATKVAKELKLFLLISFLLTASILFLFFRSIGSVVISMIVVLIGVIFSLATIYLLGFKITLLTGLIPPLIVVIGIPNCVYFINKYHYEYAQHQNKIKALVQMVKQMGVVTLFTNITAAIGFGVFCYTKSTILNEFGLVASINIMLIFLVSFIFLPAILSYLPVPKQKHTNYLESTWVKNILALLNNIVFSYRPWIYGITTLAIIWSVVGMFKLNSNAYIVDDIPHTDKIYKDLKYIENNYKGVMPLEILVDTKKKNGATNLPTLNKINQLSEFIASNPEFSRPLSVSEGVKFARQAYYNGNPASYSMPNQFDISFIAPYLKNKKGSDNSSNMSKITSAFMDSTRQVARLSVSMADVGSARLPDLLNSLRPKIDSIFNPEKFNVTFTGSSIVFLEGSKFIINGLTESILLAFLLIIGCMFYLFRSVKMLFIALIPNVIPLIITAGIMGWAGVRIKPSTVLVFSIALGIAIDVTIRFLVNFKQELPKNYYDISKTVKSTINETGLSIIYTSLILFSGFMIFSFSGFEGTKALGWLTSLTILLAMITNLTILPALILWMERAMMKKIVSTQGPFDLEEDIDLDKLGLENLERIEDNKPPTL